METFPVYKSIKNPSSNNTSSNNTFVIFSLVIAVRKKSLRSFS